MNELIKKNNIQYYTFSPLSKFSKEIIHCFTTKNTGVSSNSYESLNLGIHVGDRVENVARNRQITSSCFGVSAEQGVALKQVHGNKVVVAEKADKGKGMFSYEDCLAEADGVITSTPGILLTLYFADCVPIYIYNPKVKVIGLAHAGWQGSLLNIPQELISKLNKNFNSKSEDCLAVIGPSIGPCCYEIDEVVFDKFKNKFINVENFVAFTKNTKMKLNLWEINKRLLLEAGLCEKNIYVSEMCTSCMQKHFFSYRRDKGKTGRMAALMSIRG